MKNITLIIAVLKLSICVPVFGQNDIAIGKMDSIDSKILGENRRLMIHVPNDGPNSLFVKKKYPVV